MEVRSTWISTVARSQGPGPAKLVSEGGGGGARAMRRVLNSSLLAARLASAPSTSVSHRAISFRSVAQHGRRGGVDESRGQEEGDRAVYVACVVWYSALADT